MLIIIYALSSVKLPNFQIWGCVKKETNMRYAKVRWKPIQGEGAYSAPVHIFSYTSFRIHSIAVWIELRFWLAFDYRWFLIYSILNSQIIPAGGPRMDRRAVTSSGVVQISRLASLLQRSAWLKMSRHWQAARNVPLVKNVTSLTGWQECPSG